MKVTFIKPNIGRVNGRPYFDRGRMEPLTFGVLAGQVPEGTTCVLYDDGIESIPFDEPTDLVAINVETFTARRAYEIAGEYRKRGVQVVLGGVHVSLLPEEGARFADAVAVGDAEGCWQEMLADAAAGRLQAIYRNTAPVDLAGLRTRWELFANKRYLPIRLTHFTRGCVNQCNYCAPGNVYCKSHIHRPPEEVVEELRAQRAPIVFFVDDNIVANPDAAKELFRLMIPLKRRWFSQGSLNFAEDRELMDLMVRSGCSGLLVGFESISAENLRLMNKTVNLRHIDYDAAIEKTREMGLLLWAAFILGYDHDTPATIRRTVEWSIEKKFCFAGFNILTPYPGTPLYAEYQAAGRLLYDQWWLDPDYRFNDCVFQPALMASDELRDACYHARLSFNTVSSIVSRAFDFKTNARSFWSFCTYMAYNPLFRNQMYTKHRMQLGYHDELPSPIVRGSESTICRD